MSKSQNPTGNKPGKARRGPPRPTTARRSPAGLVISVLLHGGLIAGTYLTWNRMIEMSPESHAVPVELVVAQQTNIRAEAPPEDQKLPQKLTMDEPQLPDFIQLADRQVDRRIAPFANENFQWSFRRGIDHRFSSQ